MLGLADLVRAREKNHLDLMSRKNVVGTAVGLYLIRRADPGHPRMPLRSAGRARSPTLRSGLTRGPAYWSSCGNGRKKRTSERISGSSGRRELACVSAQMRYSSPERPGDGPGFEDNS
jgi:hypothetical protein